MRPLCSLEYFKPRKNSCLRHGTLEMRDRLSIALMIVAVIVFLILIFRGRWEKYIQRDTTINKSIDLIAISLVFAAISSKDYYRSFDDWKVNEFSGFGYDIAFVMAILSVIALSTFFVFEVSSLLKNVYSKNRKKLTFFLIAIFFVFYFPALVQLPSGLSSRDDSVYVYNDMVGAAAGNFPFADFMPHYNSLLGWPIWLFSKFLGPESVFMSIPIFLSLLNFCVIFIITKLVQRVFPRTHFGFGLIVVCSLLITRSSDTRYAYTSQSFPSWVSRLFLPTCGALLVHFLFARINKSSKNFLFLLLGFTSIFILINNLEFGLTAALSISFVILLFAVTRLIKFSDLVLYISGLLAGVLTIFGLYKLSGRSIETDFYFMIPKEVAANGYFSRPMPIFGLYLLAYSLVGITLVFAVKRVMALASRNTSLSDGKQLADLALCLFGGFWSVQCFTYYSSRSVDGNLRTLFVPIMLAIVPFLKVADVFTIDQLKRTRLIVPSLPIVLTCLIPFALIIKAPDPHANWTRILNSESSWSWQTTKNRPIAMDVMRIANTGREKIGLMAWDGNAVELVTGVQNLLLTPNFEILGLSERMRSRVCSALLDSAIEIVFVEGDFKQNKVPPCPGLINPILSQSGQVTRFDVVKP